MFGSRRRLSSLLPRLVFVVGGLVVLVAVARTGLALLRGDAVDGVALNLIYVGVSGLVLMYAGYWLPSSGITRRYYPRLVAWILGGVAVMQVFLLLRALHPQVSVEWTTGTQAIALMIGTIGGLLIGIQETKVTRRRTQLETLNRATGELFTAETRAAVGALGVEIARDVLDHDANAIHLYDDEAAGLVPIAATDPTYDLLGELPTFTDGDDSIAWRVYETGDSLLYSDVQDAADLYNPNTPVRSELLLPLGDDGVLIVTSDTRDAFDDYDLILGEILAGNVATALTQVEQTTQLRLREEELVDRNDRLEQFSSVVSHDLRNPLNVAQGRLELAREEPGSEHLDAIDRALDRMDELITDLLTLARERDPVTDSTVVDLAALVEDCWHTVETDGAALLVEIDRPIRADESRLRQLLENLFRNSVEHSSTGNRPEADDTVEHGSTSPASQAQQDSVEHGSTGGESQTDAVDNGEPAVTVRVGVVADGFYVEDDGPGIPEASRDEVFDAGYSTAATGTGFGLHIVEQVADAHGWTVRVTDGPAGGARFEITGVEFVDGDE